ncbi:MAG: Rrf2 family transcriptional regulator [Candidatus Omnitrophica bacterium]|nr:Rrf2 family transcriptional regulator [Candidatus Omnitrophota bacterium]
MTVSTTHGLNAMVDLALHEGQGPIPVTAIAKRQGIPVDGLGQLLHRLRRAGLVAAARGARGGYALSRPPSQISAADILQVFETKAARRTGRSALETGQVADQATRLVWTRIEVAVTTALATTTLAELAAEARRRHTNHTVNHHYPFYI